MTTVFCIKPSSAEQIHACVKVDRDIQIDHKTFRINASPATEDSKTLVVWFDLLGDGAEDYDPFPPHPSAEDQDAAEAPYLIQNEFVTALKEISNVMPTPCMFGLGRENDITKWKKSDIKINLSSPTKKALHYGVWYDMHL